MKGRRIYTYSKNDRYRWDLHSAKWYNPFIILKMGNPMLISSPNLNTENPQLFITLLKIKTPQKELHRSKKGNRRVPKEHTALMKLIRSWRLHNNQL